MSEIKYKNKSKMSGIATRDTRQDAWRDTDPGDGSQNKVENVDTTQARPKELTKIRKPGLGTDITDKPASGI